MIERFYLSLHKKWSFPFKISLVNVTKSAVSCGFGHLLKKSLMENFIFLRSVYYTGSSKRPLVDILHVGCHKVVF